MKKTFLTALCTLVLMGAAPTSLWNGNSAGFQLSWSEADLRIKSAKTQFSLFPPTPALDPDPEIRCEYEWGLKPLSWVGPYLSFARNPIGSA